MGELNLLFHTQESTLGYIDRLDKLIQKGGDGARVAIKLKNELILYLQGLKVVEQQ